MAFHGPKLFLLHLINFPHPPLQWSVSPREDGIRDFRVLDHIIAYSLHVGLSWVWDFAFTTVYSKKKKKKMLLWLILGTHFVLRFTYTHRYLEGSLLLNQFSYYKKKTIHVGLLPLAWIVSQVFSAKHCFPISSTKVLEFIQNATVSPSRVRLQN